MAEQELTVSGVIALANECSVPISPACKRVGLAYSNIFRWQSPNGTNPSEDSLRRFYEGVVLTAAERGTLPKRLHTEARRIADSQARSASNTPTRRRLARIRSEIDRLEQELDQA